MFSYNTVLHYVLQSKPPEEIGYLVHKRGDYIHHRLGICHDLPPLPTPKPTEVTRMKKEKLLKKE